jgi:hypothetical protein
MSERLICKVCKRRVGLVAAPKDLSGCAWKHFTNRKIVPPHAPHPIKVKGKSK